MRLLLIGLLAFGAGCVSKEDQAQLDQLDRALADIDRARAGGGATATDWVECSNAAKRAARFRQIRYAAVDDKVRRYLDGCGRDLPTAIIRSVLANHQEARCEDALEAAAELSNEAHTAERETLAQLAAMCCGPQSHVVDEGRALCRALLSTTAVPGDYAK